MKNAKRTAEPEKAETTTTQPTVVENNLPTVQSNTPAGLVPSDIVIPKVLLMQGLSELVAERKAQMGDIVRSTTAEKLGGPEKAIDFIPLSMPEAFWVIELLKDKKFVFKKMIPRNAANSRMEWNFFADQDGNEVAANTPGAIQARRVQRLALYALLPSDIEADLVERKKAETGDFPDFSKALMPVLIAFRSLSFAAGKEVVSFFTQVASFPGRSAWEAILSLKCSSQSNDKGHFYVFEVDRSRPRPVPKEQLETVKYWASVVNTQRDTLRVDDSHDEEAGLAANGGGHF